MASVRTSPEAPRAAAPSAVRVGFAAAACILVVAVLLATSAESLTAVVSATWEASGTLAGRR